MEKHLFIEKMLNRKCQRCGYHEFYSSIQVHHINHDRTNNNDDNLIDLCANCHTGLHQKQWELKDIGIKQPKITPKHKPKRNKIIIDWNEFDRLNSKYTPLEIIADKFQISKGYLQIKINERNRIYGTTTKT